MPEEKVAPSIEGTASDTPHSIRDVYDAAWEENPPEGTGETEKAETAPPEKPGTESSKEAESEAEHIKWAKSIDGDYDKATGQFVTDRVIKRAYELHKQSQQTAQLNAGLQRVLQHPEIFPIARRVLSGQQPEAKPEAKAVEAEKTEEQILEEFVLERARKLVEPLQQQNERLYQRYVDTEAQSAYASLCEEFGKDESGAFVYDKIKDQIGQQFAATAAQMNATPQQLVRVLVERGQLYDVFATTARNILYPTLRQKAAETSATAQAQKVEDLKRVRLPQRATTPSREVRKSGKEIKTFKDAVDAAEEEIAAAGRS